jgi:hypothetical protein
MTRPRTVLEHSTYAEALALARQPPDGAGIRRADGAGIMRAEHVDGTPGAAFVRPQ